MHTVLHKTELIAPQNILSFRPMIIIPTIIPHDYYPHDPPPEGPSHHHHRHHHHHHQDPPQAIGSRLAAILANDSPEQEPVCRLDQTFHDPVGLYVSDYIIFRAYN